jgi:hypothetical protein
MLLDTSFEVFFALFINFSRLMHGQYHQTGRGCLLTDTYRRIINDHLILIGITKPPQSKQCCFGNAVSCGMI